MKKQQGRKLTLHRDTVARLESGNLSRAAGGVESSCTYECGCPGGCSGDQPCMAGGLENARLDA
jgi:hypothetical protein